MSIEKEKQARNQRFAEALTLHAIEGQPLSQAQIAMFEEFERKGVNDDERLAHLRAKYGVAQDVDLAAE